MMPTSLVVERIRGSFGGLDQIYRSFRLFDRCL